MPWGAKTVEKSRIEFVCTAITGEQSMSSLCREYGITRKTGYKWLERYRKGESMGDHSHAALLHANRSSLETEALVLCERAKHPTWGPRKLRKALEVKGHVELPAVSTFAAILKRNGCIDPDEGEKHTAFIRFEREKPNELWQMDFKGDFGMLNGKRCHPLTILDDHSRYSLCLQAKENEQSDGTFTSITNVFKENGLPDTILCDNGNPWGVSKGGYSVFDVWMMRLGVLPLHGRPLHPQTQGKDERFHRTLKTDLLKRIAMIDLYHAQNEFDHFRYSYNFERPHEALGLDVPSKHYHPSRRALPTKTDEPEYDSGRVLRKVNYKGYISIQKRRYYLSEAFASCYLELIYEPNDVVTLCYGGFRIGQISLAEQLQLSRQIFRR